MWYILAVIYQRACNFYKCDYMYISFKVKLQNVKHEFGLPDLGVHRLFSQTGYHNFILRHLQNSISNWIILSFS